MPRRPSPPKTIPPGRWRTMRTEALDKIGTPTRVEVELVDQLVINLMQSEVALREAAKEPIQVGGRGQAFEHPGFKIAARCQASALSIATKIGVLDVVKQRDEDQEAKGKESTSVKDELAEIRKRKASA